MIECRWAPAAGGVANAAIGGEAGGDVIGGRGPSEVRLVASVASCGRRHVVVVGVALSARYGCVHAGERIVRVEGVIECGVKPVGCRVADAAVVGQAELHMGRVVGAKKVGGVARIAICRRSGEYIIDVACGARQRGVYSGQRVAGIFQVVELGTEPTVHAVAALAGGWETGRDVIEHRRQEVLLMAGVAGGRKSLELPCGGVFVAFIALNQSMCSHQRKAILVILDRIQGDIPTLDGVTIFAIGAELPTMQIGMAICALLTDIFENEADMALGAGYLLVHSAQGIACAVVVEVRDLADRPPTRVGVAVLAGNGERTMRIGHPGLRAAHIGTHLV